MIWALVVLTAFTVAFVWLWRDVMRGLSSNDPYIVDIANTHIIILTAPSAILLLLWGIAIWKTLL